MEHATYQRPVTGKLFVRLSDGDSWEAHQDDLAKFGLMRRDSAYARTMLLLGKWLDIDLTEHWIAPLRYFIERQLSYPEGDELSLDYLGDTPWGLLSHKLQFPEDGEWLHELYSLLLGKTPIDMGEDLPHALSQLAGQLDETNPWTQQLIDVIDKYVTHEQTGGEGEDA